MNLTKPFLANLVVVVMIAITGCDKSPQVVEVTGKVLLDNKPLELVQVEFWPSEGPRSIGKTDLEGNFQLELDDRSKKGAVAGKHKVLLRDTWPTKDNVLSKSGEWIDNSNGKKSRISTQYYDVSLTKLEFEVKSGEKNHFEIPVKPKK